MSEKNKKNRHVWIIMALLVLFDFLAISGSYVLALWIRFDCNYNAIGPQYLSWCYETVLFYAVFCVILFWAFKLYRSIWKFASFMELARITLATLIGLASYVIVMAILKRRMPISYYLFGGVFQFVLTTGVRFSYRFVRLLKLVFILQNSKS